MGYDVLRCYVERNPSLGMSMEWKQRHRGVLIWKTSSVSIVHLPISAIKIPRQKQILPTDNEQVQHLLQYYLAAPSTRQPI